MLHVKDHVHVFAIAYHVTREGYNVVWCMDGWLCRRAAHTWLLLHRFHSIHYSVYSLNSCDSSERTSNRINEQKKEKEKKWSSSYSTKRRRRHYNPIMCSSFVDFTFSTVLSSHFFFFFVIISAVGPVQILFVAWAIRRLWELSQPFGLRLSCARVYIFHLGFWNERENPWENSARINEVCINWSVSTELRKNEHTLRATRKYFNARNALIYYLISHNSNSICATECFHRQLFCFRFATQYAGLAV